MSNTRKCLICGDTIDAWDGSICDECRAKQKKEKSAGERELNTTDNSDKDSTKRVTRKEAACQ